MKHLNLKLRPQVFLGMIQQVLHIKIWHYLLFFSSPLHVSFSVRLDGTGAHFQVSPEIFDWVQAQALAGTLKDIHRVVYKTLLLCVWFIVLLEGESSAQSEVLNALGWVFMKAISIVWCIELFFTLTSPSVPATEKQPPPPHEGCFFTNSKSVFTRLHWREYGVWLHHHKAQIGGVLQGCLSFCRSLPSVHTIMDLN